MHCSFASESHQGFHIHSSKAGTSGMEWKKGNRDGRFVVCTKHEAPCDRCFQVPSPLAIGAQSTYWALCVAGSFFGSQSPFQPISLFPTSSGSQPLIDCTGKLSLLPPCQSSQRCKRSLKLYSKSNPSQVVCA